MSARECRAARSPCRDRSRGLDVLGARPHEIEELGDAERRPRGPDPGGGAGRERGREARPAVRRVRRGRHRDGDRLAGSGEVDEGRSAREGGRTTGLVDGPDGEHVRKAGRVLERALPWERSGPEAATTSEPVPNAMFTIASSSGSREFEPRLRLMTPVPRRRAVSMPETTPDTEMPARWGSRPRSAKRPGGRRRRSPGRSAERRSWTRPLSRDPRSARLPTGCSTRPSTAVPRTPDASGRPRVDDGHGLPGPGGSTVPAPIGATHHWVGTSESPELKCMAVGTKRSGSTRSANGATRRADRLARRQTGRLRAMRTPPARRSLAAARASWASTSACEWARSSPRSVEVRVADTAGPDYTSAATRPAMRVTPKPLKQDNIATTCTRPTSASDRI